MSMPVPNSCLHLWYKSKIFSADVKPSLKAIEVKKILKKSVGKGLAERPVDGVVTAVAPRAVYLPLMHLAGRLAG